MLSDEATRERAYRIGVWGPAGAGVFPSFKAAIALAQQAVSER